MILDGIDVFVRVVQAQSFSAAARQLGMPATTVSAKIARLEQHLGTTLIQRSTRRMHVTASGERYFHHCVAALAALQTGEEELAAGAAQPSGRLRITAPPDLSQLLLSPIVRRYLEHYPGTEVELVVTNEPLDLIARGIDLAVRAGPAMKDSTLVSRRFVTASLGLFASAEYLKAHGTPRRPADLAGHEVLVISGMPPLGMRLSGKGASFELKPNARLRADDMQTIRAYVAAGGGIGLFPTLAAGELRRVLPAYATEPNSVHFVYPGQRFVPVNVRSFIELALAQWREALGMKGAADGGA